MDNASEVERVVSLGSLCLTGVLLQSLYLKRESYPFDWVFSTPEIVAHCLDDDFEAFLNRDYFRSCTRDCSRKCYHTLFSSQVLGNPMFNHRDPCMEEDYSYYQRCVSRFRNLMLAPRPTLFVLFNDQGSRCDTSSFDAVSAALHRRTNHSALLYVSHRPGGDSSFTVGKVINRHVMVELEAISSLNNGVEFLAPADNDVARNIIQLAVGGHLVNYATEPGA